MCVNDCHVSSFNFVVSHCSCLYGGIITHVVVFDWLTLNFLHYKQWCLTFVLLVKLCKHRKCLDSSDWLIFVPFLVKTKI